MTLEEVAQQLRYSEATLLHQFKRCQKTLAKKGIILTRWGRGKDTEYEIEYEFVEKEE